ncbi:MAG: L-threonylcarbamoyladenylate synthase [Desulfovibrio sp.]|nr:L-threonylcarbamoyladenylate synthase [Desulfovibrio sp.]
MFSCLWPAPDGAALGIDLAESAQLLRCGGMLVLPTETLYGLACLAADAEAVARVYQVKQRPVHKPLPLLAGHVSQVGSVADLTMMPPGLCAFWPGPLTVLLPVRVPLPLPLVDANGRIALRVTSHPQAAALALRAGGVLTASSANVSGMSAPRRMEDLDEKLLAALQACNATLSDTYSPSCLPVLAGALPPCGGKPSTIVEPLRRGQGWALRMVREGAVSVAALTKAGFAVV